MPNGQQKFNFENNGAPECEIEIDRFERLKEKEVEQPKFDLLRCNSQIKRHFVKRTRPHFEAFVSFRCCLAEFEGAFGNEVFIQVFNARAPI